MEINEKLDIFYRAAIDAANEQSAAMLDKYRARYEKNLAEYQQEKQKEQQTRERIAQERVRKEVNRALSEEMLQLKKEYHKAQEERKEELFVLVEQKITDYRATDAYEVLLEQKIARAVQFANGEDMRVYIDPADARLEQELTEKCGCKISLSAYSFGGGIRAVIPAKNVLIDESFDSKLAAEREQFSF